MMSLSRENQLRALADPEIGVFILDDGCKKTLEAKNFLRNLCELVGTVVKTEEKEYATQAKENIATRASKSEIFKANLQLIADETKSEAETIKGDINKKLLLAAIYSVAQNAINQANSQKKPAESKENRWAEHERNVILWNKIKNRFDAITGKIEKNGVTAELEASEIKEFFSSLIANDSGLHAARFHTQLADYYLKTNESASAKTYALFHYEQAAELFIKEYEGVRVRMVMADRSALEHCEERVKELRQHMQELSRQDREEISMMEEGVKKLKKSMFDAKTSSEPEDRRKKAIELIKAFEQLGISSSTDEISSYLKDHEYRKSGKINLTGAVSTSLTYHLGEKNFYVESQDPWVIDLDHSPVLTFEFKKDMVIDDLIQELFIAEKEEFEKTKKRALEGISESILHA